MGILDLSRRSLITHRAASWVRRACFSVAPHMRRTI